MINWYHADISLSWGGHRYEKTAVRSIGWHRADNQYSHCWSRESTLHWWEAVGEVTNALSQKDFTRVHIPCVETVSFWSEPIVSHFRWLNFLVPPSGASTNLKEPHRSHRFQKHLTINPHSKTIQLLFHSSLKYVTKSDVFWQLGNWFSLTWRSMTMQWPTSEPRIPRAVGFVVCGLDGRPVTLPFPFLYNLYWWYLTATCNTNRMCQTVSKYKSKNATSQNMF